MVLAERSDDFSEKEKAEDVDMVAMKIQTIVFFMVNDPFIKIELIMYDTIIFLAKSNTINRFCNNFFFICLVFLTE